jgi:hypothetical protein
MRVDPPWALGHQQDPRYLAWLGAQPDLSGGFFSDIQQQLPAIRALVGVFTGSLPFSNPGASTMANGFDWGGDMPGAGGGGVIGSPDTTPVGDTVDPTTGITTGPGEIFTGIQQVLGTGGGVGGVPDFGGGQMIPTAGSAAAMGTVGGLAMRMSSIVAGAILKLKQTIGGGGFLTASGISAFGAKTWRALSAWAAKNPAVSIISILVSLGLTVEEAAHFMAWGTSRRRRHRARGITPRDMRTTRRTMIKVISMSQKLRELCVAVPHRARTRRTRRA